MDVRAAFAKALKKKRSSMQDTIKSKVKGAKNQDKVWDLYTEALGFDSNSLGDKYKMQR